MEKIELYKLFDLLGEYLEEQGYSKNKIDALGRIEYRNENPGRIQCVMEFEATSDLSDDILIRKNRGSISDGQGKIKFVGFNSSQIEFRFCQECDHKNICKLRDMLKLPEAEALGFVGCKHFKGIPKDIGL